MKHFIIQYIILMASIQLGYSQESSVYDSYVPFPISSPKLSCSAMPRQINTDSGQANAIQGKRNSNHEVRHSQEVKHGSTLLPPYNIEMCAQPR